MKFLRRTALALFTGILLWLSWPPHGFALLSFFAFVPLFWLSEELADTKTRSPFFAGLGYSFLAFTVWNSCTTWWVWNSTSVGAIAMILLNALFMAIFFGAWQRFRSLDLPKIISPICFISFWCTWEFLHLNWDLMWPWLNLGNIFSSCTEFVQWYEVTGAFGGTVWILVANFLALYFLKSVRETTKRRWHFAIALLAWLVVPAALSLIRYSTYQLPDEKTGNPIEVVIVQPNTDPWVEEYAMDNEEHAQRIMHVASTKATPNTRLIVCPESAISNTIGLENFQKNLRVGIFNAFGIMDSAILINPDLNFIFGTSTHISYATKATPTAREVRVVHGGFDTTIYEDYFNTSACINRYGVIGTYHKSKLVPGVEKMPFPQIFGFLEQAAINLGGTSGSLGLDTMQRTFKLSDIPIYVGAPICYESAFGEHFGEFVRNGANLMAVITNDAWWGETPGHTQHFLFSKLRAVETRRTIMRSANTGTSAFIDERGDAHQETEYGVRTAIRQNVYPNDRLTFYVKHGDYLARFFALLAAAFVCFGITLRIGRWTKRKIKKNELPADEIRLNG